MAWFRKCSICCPLAKREMLCVPNLFLILMSVGVVALTYRAVNPAVVFILPALALLALTTRRHRDSPNQAKRYFKALPPFTFYLLLVLGHSHVNIVGHWTGLALGIIILYFVWMTDRLFRITDYFEYKTMKVVFVCSPFQGKQENIEKAKRYCRMLVDMG